MFIFFIRKHMSYDLTAIDPQFLSHSVFCFMISSCAAWLLFSALPWNIVGNDEVNNINLMLFWKIACCVPLFTRYKKKKQCKRNNKLRNVFVLFVENSEQAPGKQSRNLFSPLSSHSHTHRLTYSKCVNSTPPRDDFKTDFLTLIRHRQTNWITLSPGGSVNATRGNH